MVICFIELMLDFNIDFFILCYRLIVKIGRANRFYFLRKWKNVPDSIWVC